MTLYQILGIIAALLVNYAGFRFAVSDQAEEERPPVPKKKAPEPIVQEPKEPFIPVNNDIFKQIARSTPLEITDHSLRPNPPKSSSSLLEDYL